MSWLAEAFSGGVDIGSRPEDVSAQTQAFSSGAGSGSHDENALTQKLGAGPRCIEARTCFRGRHR